MRTSRGLTAILLLSAFTLIHSSSSSLHSSSSSRTRHRLTHLQDRQKTLSRWRRVPEPEALVDGDIANLLDRGANLYKPEILNCGDKPVIKEEQQIDTAVLEVRAEDKDDPDTGAGQIVYSIVSTHNKFKINPQTGWISTNKIFNRDEPDREKEVHVTVKASDKGRPSLESVCTITVKIEDINDNAPIFDRASYEIPIAQDTKAGDVIMRVSATDIDEGMNQNITYSLKATNFQQDIDYFRWDEKTGMVTLKKKLDKPVGSVFVLEAYARDGGIPPKSTRTDVTIDVKESNNKPPKFRQGPGAEIELSEGKVDWSTPIASYTADSQIKEDPTLFFELLSGRTEQTNKGTTFRAVQDSENQQRVNIFLAKPLEYEKVQEYTLTLQVTNKESLVAEAQLNIKIKDENNKSPVFTNIGAGAVLEDEPPGTVVMAVSAIDGDGTYPNNRVKYSISDQNSELLEKFDINPDTGVITTKVVFDREENSYYALTIIASDGAESSLLKNGKPNQTPYKFKINIMDKNDNPPYFRQQEYEAEVPEDADIGSKVIEVTAEDADKEASLITYKIQSGLDDFSIEEQTGFIRVAKPLDYENIKEYKLTIQAWDGQFSNTTTVYIKIINVNDMPPVFKEEKYRATIKENFVPSYPIFKVQATDPDIEDPTAPQRITYFLDQSNQIAEYFQISNDGALRIVKPLDRDLPNGYPVWSMFVFAKDKDVTPGGTQSRESYVEFEITLEDVNDNAPFLNMPDGLVWPENSPPGEVGRLSAIDYDTDVNGPPFTFRIDPQAPLSFKNKFDVQRKRNGDYYLETKTRFDREQQKVYQIPVEVADNQGMKAVSLLTLVIGDKNDNPMAPGSSQIFVYNYRGLAPTTEIGRVYVKDPDDWDLPDKTFMFTDSSKFPDFKLNKDTGMISMMKGIKLDQEIKVYHMEFLVEDRTHNQVGSTAVAANVTVTVQKIPEEAVLKSGSVRLDISPEKFVSGAGGRAKLTRHLQTYLNPNATIVDVFTVLPALDGKATDVRFSAHGSPYYEPEKLEVTIAKRKKDLERDLGLSILMIHIDECLYEDNNNCEGSCYNSLEIQNEPTAIMTNTTTFVGVTARVEPKCGCKERKLYQSCRANGFGSATDGGCLNGGTCDGQRCVCPSDNTDQFGPHCEKLAASFKYGWTSHKGISACSNTTLSFSFTTKQSSGLLLYQGPSPNTVVANVTDFLALEVKDGKLKYYLNFGSTTQIGVLQKDVSDGEEHSVVMSWTNSSVSLLLDHGECLRNVRDCHLQNPRPPGKSQYFNSNGPLQVGGLYFGSLRLEDVSRSLGLTRDDFPEGRSFGGCLRNLSISEGGFSRFVSLGTPSDGEKYQDGCDMAYVLAIGATEMNLTFLVGILAVLAIILIAVVVLAMYRRRRVQYSDKDIDCDIRENIINYEDEGGGEGDQTGYDLSVLRMMASDNGGPMLSPIYDKQQQSRLPPAAAEIPAVGEFLDSSKDRLDQDPEATPYDDLRHYAYEGDGNSGGSLSSLNSSKDEDLEFEYLHNFGPRVLIEGRPATFFISGPPPTICIGQRQRQDLCKGKIYALCDEETPTCSALFLDSNPQPLQIGRKLHIIKFVEDFKIVTINDHPFRTDFGGTPMLVSVGGKKYPVRFTARPDATPAQKRPGTPMGTQGPTKRLKKGDRSCEVCGKSHSKFSDVEKRASFKLEYPCESCIISPHSSNVGKVVPVLVSSSTMNKWWGDKPANRRHVDHFTIPGAQINCLSHAFDAEYDGDEELHVCLAAGLNDVMAGKSAQEIFQRMEHFDAIVKAKNPKSTLNICTLLLPPKLVHLPGDGIKRKEGFIDYKSTIVELNRMILRYRFRTQSLPGTYRVSGFHYLGLAHNEEMGTIEGPVLSKLNAFKLSCWRESDPNNMLHGSDELRRLMGEKLNTFFDSLIGTKVTRGPDKKSGLKVDKRLRRRAKTKLKKKMNK